MKVVDFVRRQSSLTLFVDYVASASMKIQPATSYEMSQPFEGPLPLERLPPELWAKIMDADNFLAKA